jgi:hypothetical protein
MHPTKQNSEKKRENVPPLHSSGQKLEQLQNCSRILKLEYHIEQRITKHKRKQQRKYNLSEVYQLQCADSPRKYVGQTGVTFRTRFKEHARDTGNNKQNSKFAEQILDMGHEYEVLEKNMKIFHIEEKRQMLDSYERFHIYEISKQNTQLNDNVAEIYMT